MNERYVENFRKNVYEYNKIDELIRRIKQQIEPLRIQLKELKEEKKNIQKDICLFMGKNNIDICNLPKEEEKGSLKYTCSDTTTPMTHEVIRVMLNKFYNEGHDKSTAFLNCSEKGNFIFDYIKDNRPRQKKESIRKIKYATTETVIKEYEIIDQL